MVNWHILNRLLFAVSTSSAKNDNVDIFILLSFMQMAYNVRRYVALAQSRGGARFCTRGAMQDYDVVLSILALSKTVTPGGSAPKERGRAAPPTT